jgi:putative ABC transport system permease protein
VLGVTKGRGAVTRWAGTVCVLALAGGAALTAGVAARRTDTAFVRRLHASNAADVNVAANAIAAGAEARRPLDVVARAPLVADHARYGGVALYHVRGGEVDPRLVTGSASGYVAYDAKASRTLSTFDVVHGRVAATDRADEVMVNSAFVRVTGWGEGARLPDMTLFQQADLDENSNPIPGRGTRVALRVVGVVTRPEEIIRLDEVAPLIYLTPAFARRFPDAPYYYQELLTLRHGPRDIPRLRTAVSNVAQRFPDAQLFVSSNAEGLSKAQRVSDPLVNALWVLGALALVVGLVLAAQSCAREFQQRASDHALLRALGATPTQRLVAEVTGAARALAVAAVSAVVIASLASPLTPVGAARTAEPHPGFAFHGGLAAATLVIVVVGGLLVAMPSAWRVARSRALPGPTIAAGRDRVSHVANTAANVGCSVPVVVGTRFALQPGRGRSATPVRSALVSLTIVVAAVSGIVAFGVNLARLTNTPRLYGWNWDVAVGSPFGAIPPDVGPRLTRDRSIAGIAGLTIGELRIADVSVPGIGVDRLMGDLTPRVDDGRLPRRADEMALGAKTLRQAHAHIGGRLHASVGGHDHTFRVVGTATFPAFGAANFSEAGLGTGALGVADLFPQHDPSEPDGKYNYILLRYRPSVSKPAAIAALRRFVADDGCVEPSCVLTNLRPTEIDGFHNARAVPIPVAVVLVLLLTATLTHVLVTTIRRRAGDLAVLRALGFRRRQLAATLRWQTTILVVSALLLGVPLGIISNGLAWRAFTHQFGVSPGTVLPIAMLGAGAIVMIVLAWLVGAAGGHRAQRIARAYRLTA